MSQTADDKVGLFDRSDAERLLYLEARLLDEGKFDQWLELFCQDALYWLPISAKPGEPSLIRDNRAAMEERVFRIENTTVHAQIPRSRTQHDVTNVEVEFEGGDVVIRCNQVVRELRMGAPGQRGLGVARSLPSRCSYRLKWENGWKISEKICVLLERDLPLYNLTFIY